MSHTIVLVQPTPSKASRTFSDYESVVKALDGVCAMFEKRLKELNPQMRQITYDINDLYRYLDTLHDLSALVFAPGAWVFFPLAWGGGGGGIRSEHPWACQPLARTPHKPAGRALLARCHPPGNSSLWAVSCQCGGCRGGRSASL
jgi:hypothetical protein